MHKELVERRRWISESQFLRFLNLCMLLPGPEAQQLATFAVGSFVAIYFLSVPFPLVVGAAGLTAFLPHFRYPEVFRTRRHGESSEEEDEDTTSRPSALRNLQLLGIFLLLWVAPVGA